MDENYYLQNSDYIIEENLMDGESILWKGKPQIKIFTIADIPITIFALFWCGFVTMWEINAIKMSPKTPGFDFFPIFGLPFVIVGLYLLIGRFFYRYFNLKNTHYFVTNKRIVELTKFFGKNISREIFLDSLTGVEKTVEKNGASTIFFKSTGQNFTTGNNLFLTGFSQIPSGTIIFRNIKDGNSVYNLVMSYKEKKKNL